MSATDKIFFSVFVFAGLVAGICIGYGVADSRGRAKLEEQRDYIAGLEAERDFYIDAAEQLRGELEGLRDSVGQLGDGLEKSLQTALKLTNYRQFAQVFIDTARDIISRASALAGAGAVENTEPAPLADSE